MGPSGAGAGVRGTMTRILVVDDDPAFRQELEDLLIGEGFETVAVPGGPEALDVLARRPFDVMLTDLRMPGMNGIDLLRTVRERYPEVYPVMLTGYSTAESAVQALSAGAFDYVPKPFRLEQVTNVLRHLDQEREFRRRWSEMASHPRETVAALARTGQQLTVFVWGVESYVGAHVVSLPEPSTSDGRGQALALGRIEELVRSHVRRVSGPMVLLERADRLFGGDGDPAVLGFLERAAAECRSRGGRLLVTVRPGSLSDARSTALLRALRESFAPEMTNSLASPVRRSLVVRLSGGPARLIDLGTIDGIEDEGKAFFHLQKLIRGGIVTEVRDRYALTEMGSHAAEFLARPSPAAEGPVPGLLWQTA